MVTETADPIRAVAPTPGFWLITVPMLLQLLSMMVLTLPRTKPAACSTWLARAVISRYEVSGVSADAADAIVPESAACRIRASTPPLWRRRGAYWVPCATRARRRLLRPRLRREPPRVRPGPRCRASGTRSRGASRLPLWSRTTRDRSHGWCCPEPPGARPAVRSPSVPRLRSCGCAVASLRRPRAPRASVLPLGSRRSGQPGPAPSAAARTTLCACQLDPGQLRTPDEPYPPPAPPANPPPPPCPPPQAD